MAVISEVKLSEIESRMDAEYFHPSYLEIEKKLEQLSENPNFNVVTLKSISSRVRKGIFSILKTEYKTEGVPFIRASNIENLMIDEDNLTYISEERNEREKKTCLHPKDIVVVKGGVGVGEVAIIPPFMPVLNISQDVIGISVKSRKVVPEYVGVYLASKFGKLWFKRNRSIVAQPHLELRPVRKLPVPLPPPNEQQKIANWVSESIEEYTKARESYVEALLLLNRLLGLESYEPKRKKAFQVSLSAIEESDGWSSEQHLPEYSDLIEKVGEQGYPLSPFGKVIRLSKKRIDPSEEPQKTFRYVELSNVSPSFGSIEGFSEMLGRKAPSRARMLLSEGDVLIPYLRGSFGKVAIVTKEHHGMVGSTGFHVVRSKVYDNWFLLTLLRSEVFQKQLLQKAAGTIMQSVSARSLRTTLLPIIPREDQVQIAKLMKSSHDCKKRSQEIALKAVAYLENSLENAIAD